MKHRLSKERVYSGKILNVDRERVLNPAGAEVDLEIIRHPGAAAVVPLLSGLDDPNPTVVLIRQFRYAADGNIWEIPAGVLEPGEEPEVCARRELREEIGGSTPNLLKLTSLLTTPGFTDELIHLYVATDVTLDRPDHQPDELIELHRKPMSEVLTMIKDGSIRDGKTVAALFYAFHFILNR